MAAGAGQQEVISSTINRKHRDKSEVRRGISPPNSTISDILLPRKCYLVIPPQTVPPTVDMVFQHMSLR